MKTFVKSVSAALFAIVFFLALISSSYDPRFRDTLFGYFSNHNSLFIMARAFVFFLLLLLTTYINRNNPRCVSIIYAALLLLMMAAVYYDYFHSHHLLYNFYYAIMVCATVSAACISVFIGGTLFFQKQDYLFFFRIFWIVFLSVYLFLLYIAFLRSPESFSFSYNYHIGQGTIKYFKAILQQPNDIYLMFICFGNILVLMPIPFIIYAVSKKANLVVNICVSVLLPVLIESYQYIFKCGDVDIDDIILNAAGMMISYVILKQILKNKTEKIPASS